MLDDDDESDAGLDAAASDDDDDDRTLEATPPSSANNHDTSVPAHTCILCPQYTYSLTAPKPALHLPSHSIDNLQFTIPISYVGDDATHIYIRQFAKKIGTLAIQKLCIEIALQQFAQIVTRNQWTNRPYYWTNQEEITSDICEALDCLGSLGLSKEKLSIEVKLPTDKPIVGFDVREYRLPQQIKERYEDRLSQPPPPVRRSARHLEDIEEGANTAKERAAAGEGTRGRKRKSHELDVGAPEPKAKVARMGKRQARARFAT